MHCPIIVYWEIFPLSERKKKWTLILVNLILVNLWITPTPPCGFKIETCIPSFYHHVDLNICIKRTLLTHIWQKLFFILSRQWSLNQYASYDDQNKKSFCATHAYWYGEIERERKWQGCIIKCLKHFLNSYASSLRNFTSDLFCQKFWMMSRLLKYNCKVQTVSVEEYKKIFCHLYLWTDFVLIHD